MKKLKGFTLVELMITLIVLGILLGLAVPSFMNLYNRNKLTTSVNKIVATVNAARIAAVKRNSTVAFCQPTTTMTSLNTACSASTSWTQWGVVGRESDGSASILANSSLDGANISVQSATRLDFGADGIGSASGSTIPYSGIVADVYTNSLSTDNHRCVAMVGGSSVRIYKRTGNCP